MSVFRSFFFLFFNTDGIEKREEMTVIFFATLQNLASSWASLCFDKLSSYIRWLWLTSSKVQELDLSSWTKSSFFLSEKGCKATMANHHGLPAPINYIGSLAALDSRERNSWFLFPIHLHLCILPSVLLCFHCIWIMFIFIQGHGCMWSYQADIMLPCWRV